MQEAILQRHTHKTSEGEFLNELENLFNFSPKESELVLESAKRHLIREHVLKEGQIEVSVVSIEEKSGKLIEQIEKRRVILTIDGGIEDNEIRMEYGRIELRKVRIQRITEEAIEQRGVLSQEDLARYLSCDLRTIQRDIQEIKRQGIEIVSRGVLHSIGRGQTHKRRIIELYLDGKTFSEIKRLTHHSTGSIKRYVESFVRALMSVHYRFKDISQISTVTGLSEYLVNQYKEIIKESWKIKHRRERLEEMISQWKRAGSQGIKKSLKMHEKAVFPTIGDGI
jgi:DNA-binding transcriptional regulator YhcF (GntR family)